MEQLVSIIVPMYKVENYLRQCLESIINQSYKNLEIILVDDGSPDNCGKICDEYAKKDNRIKVIHKENGGLSSARNAGLDIATGEYISFIDSDDYVDEKFIERLYKLCIENNCDISECNFVKFENEVFKDSKKYDAKIYTNYEMQKRLYIPEFFARGIVVWNKLYKRYLYENMRFPLGKINEDEFVTYKVLYNCKSKIATTDERLYFYRTSANSIMGQKFNPKRLDVLDAFEERKEFYKNRNENELYFDTVCKYQKMLKKMYSLAKESDCTKSFDYGKLNDSLKKNILPYLQNNKASVKEKIKMLLFSIMPGVYYFVYNLKANFFKHTILKLIFIMSFAGKKDCLLIGTPAHENLGDSEIVLAERKFLKDKGFTFFEITVPEYINYKDIILRNKDKYKIILLHGGGNFGDEYENEEKIRRDIVKEFNDKKIIMFPQTIYFSDSQKGNEELNVSTQIYNSHPDFTIFVREKYSFEFAKKHFKNVFLMPDIVLYLRKYKKKNNSNFVLFLLRNDKEKYISSKEIQKIYEELKKSGVKYTVSDMMSHLEINKLVRKFIVDKKHKQIRKYNLIITDRLHGMVFAYLNSKKCIALSNYNYKVKGTYDWIKKDKNIIYAESISKIDINQIKSLMKRDYDTIDYVDQTNFEELYKILRRKIDECTGIIKQ